MRKFHVPLFIFLAGLTLFNAPGFSQERDRVGGDFRRADSDDDGQLTREEWNRRGNFQRLDADNDGYLSLPEVRAMYAGHSETSYDWPPPGFERTAPQQDSSVAADLVDSGAIGGGTMCAIGRGRKCDPKAPIGRGLFETGLGPVFPENALCHAIDDPFALNYTFKRNKEAYHGGIDMPARWGTPMIAAAAGTVVGTFMGERSPRGIEILIRHTPEDTGLPLWIYTGYGHLDRMPDLQVGQRLRLGEIIGPTGNSGVGGKKRTQTTRRRPAIHFSAFFAETAKYANHRDVIIPVDGRWVDPIALYRQKLPLDSLSMKKLPEGEKGVPIAVMFEDGEVFPAGAKFVWPYVCKRVRRTAETATAGDAKKEPSFTSAKMASLETLIEHGLEKTGLHAVYPSGVHCPKVGSGFADTTRADGSTRNATYYHGRHGGIDIYMPEGTMIRAIADGTVIHMREGAGIGGLGVTLQHAPEDTGLQGWTYSAYEHLTRLPDFEIGQRIERGAKVALVGDTGSPGRFHLHMAAFWSPDDQITTLERPPYMIFPNGHWLDPHALFWGKALGTRDIQKFADADKAVPIPYMTPDGTVVPAGAKVTWPFTCGDKPVEQSVERKGGGGGGGTMGRRGGKRRKRKMR